MPDTRSRDPEPIRQEAVEPLPPTIGLDLDDRRFHVYPPPAWLPEGADTSAPGHRRTDSRDRSTRGTFRRSQSLDPGGVESAQTQAKTRQSR